MDDIIPDIQYPNNIHHLITNANDWMIKHKKMAGINVCLTGIKAVIEVIPNHTSRKHSWFQKSRLSKQQIKFKGYALEEIEKFADYYVWNEGKIGEDGSKVPPNNWVSSLNWLQFIEFLNVLLGRFLMLFIFY